MNDLACHCIEAARYFFGKDQEVVEVMAWGDRLVHHKKTKGEDNALLVLKFSGGGIGVKAEVPVAATNVTEVYSDPPTADLPDVGEEPSWHAVSSTDIVDSLTDTLSGLELQFYRPSNGNLLGTVLSQVGSVAATLVSTLAGIIDAALAPLLDPLVDFLLDALGLNLNQVDVGANLSCEGGGGTLVE